MTSLHEPVDGLRSTAYKATRWQALHSVTAQVITLASTALLARMLDARDFGLVAVVVLLLGFYEVFLQVGLSSNLVRQRELDPKAASSTHWVMSGLGFALFLAALLGAGPLAELLGSPAAAPLFRVASVILLLSTLTSTPYALLYRRLDFRRLATMTISANVTYLICAVALAGLFGLGAWAVVIGRVAQALVQTTLSYMFTRFRPTFTFDRGYIRGAASFASGMWLAWIATYVVKNADYALLSRLGTGEAVGIYYLAFTVPQLLRQRLTGVIQQVLFPVLVQTQNDAVRTRRILAEGYGTLTLVLAPAMVGLAVVAPDAVRLVFGPGWEEAVTPLRLLAAAGMFAISPLASSALEAAGKPGRAVLPTLLQAATMVGVFLVARRFVGLPSAMAAGVLVSALLRLAVDSVMLSRMGIAPTLLWLKVSYRAMLGAFLMGVLVAGLNVLLGGLPLVMRVTASVGTGIACYGLLLHALDRAGLARALRTIRAILVTPRKAEPVADKEF